MSADIEAQDSDVPAADAETPNSSTLETAAPPLQPLPYHLAVREHLQENHPDVWQWFTSGEFREQAADTIRLDLLKSTYRLEREPHGDLYALADKALETLGLDIPVTLYQTQGESGLNAFLAYLPGEAHVGFTGPLLEHLGNEETLAILGHELTHYLFFTLDNRAGLTAEQILTAMANDALGDASHEETARLYQLYTEILCDRGGYQVTGDLHVTVAALVKVHSGLAEVSAESYLRQAKEILSSDSRASENQSHPEAYIRARALALWAEQGEAAEAEIARLIEGAMKLDRLDLPRQAKVREQTRRLLAFYLAPAWFQTEAVLAHAKHFFSDFETSATDPEDLFDEIDTTDEGLRDYLCYLLLDFIALAPELEEGPYAAAFALAERLTLSERLLEIARKELGVAKRELVRIHKNASEILLKLSGEKP
jgi:hypothetical protein